MASLNAMAVGVIAAVCATGLIVAAVDVSLAAARARTAADAAALAGMGASPLVTGGLPTAAGPRRADTAGAGAVEPDVAAARVAAANGAALVRSDRRGWPLRYAVTVGVEPSSAAVRRAVSRVSATAAAAARPPLPAEPLTGHRGGGGRGGQGTRAGAGSVAGTGWVEARRGP